MAAGELRAPPGDESGTPFLRASPEGPGLWVSLSLSPPSKGFSPHLVGLWVQAGLGWKVLQKEEKVLA